MIPKIIHYCWFGNHPIPKHLKKCIDSWSKFLVDYEFIKWDESNFDINSTKWTKQAYSKKKYAFVSDYVRLKVLYEYGGIYLDTDVMVLKSFDSFLGYQAFTGFESKNKLTSAIIGAEKRFPIIKTFLDTYTNKPFINNGKNNDIANVVMMTDICVSYGFIPNNTYQVIQGMHIFPQTYFCPLDFYHNKNFTENTHAIHYFDASWLDRDIKVKIKRERSILIKIKNILKSYLLNIYLRFKS